MRTDTTHANLIARATRALRRDQTRVNAVRQESSNDGCVTEYKGETFVVLNNVTGTLAVYQLTNGNLLRRLQRWPDAVVPE